MSERNFFVNLPGEVTVSVRAETVWHDHDTGDLSFRSEKRPVASFTDGNWSTFWEVRDDDPKPR